MTPKDILKITLNLVIIYVVGGFILAGVYSQTSPIIFRNAVLEKEAALKKLIPEADRIDKLGDWTIHEKHAEYFIAKKDDKPVGYIIQSFGKGYSSYINTLIAVDTDFTIRNISILGQAETPGLGDGIETDDFKNQFRGKDIDHLSVVKTGSDGYIEALSGATITTRAVAEDAVKNSLVFLTEKIKDEKGEDGGDR
ncbi:MAG: FMN-binding protein [Nitrospirota bacterium]